MKNIQEKAKEIKAYALSRIDYFTNELRNCSNDPHEVEARLYAIMRIAETSTNDVRDLTFDADREARS